MPDHLPFQSWLPCPYKIFHHLSVQNRPWLSQNKNSPFISEHIFLLLSSQSSVPISLQKSTMHPPSLKFTTFLLSTKFYIHLKNPPLSFRIHGTLFEYKSMWIFVTQCFPDLLIKDFHRTAQTLLASHSLASQTFSAIVSCSGKPFHSL